MTGPGTFSDWEEKEKQRKADAKEEARLRALEQQVRRPLMSTDEI